MSKLFYSAKSYRALKTALSEANAAATAWKRAAEYAKEDLNMWRAKYELSQLNPEVKADVEGAFKRGAQFAKQVALQNVMEMVQSIPTDEPKDQNA